MELTDEQVRRFHESGYLVLTHWLTEPRRQRYLAILDRLVEQSRTLTTTGDGFHLAFDGGGQPIPGLLHKIQGLCVVEPALLELAAEPALRAAVGSLLGSHLDVFGTKFYPMNIAGGTSTDWHQDNHYFGTQSEQVISCAIYLQPTTVENGCLRVAPGSHRSGSLAPHERGSGIYSHGSWTPVAEDQSVDLVCEPGTAVLFSANLLHGARPNLSGEPSYRTAWHYIPGHLDLPLFPRGVYADRHILPE
ncbi:MAG: phytanoyl-CoA dioxygenase family protein [Armatimonadetes bacterium]|nr:phytanoyl-CoA dioxygenase family protein [Armatimonadota bacterium]